MQHLPTVSAIACFAILSVLSPAHAAPACKQDRKIQAPDVQMVLLPVKFGSGDGHLVPTRALAQNQNSHTIGVCEFILSQQSDTTKDDD
ncbi:hypothetical protein [uncultured Marivita sp.]|jgi:hypothetical protein|uniref:hypothetical protein n=1 Tax=Marivita sp. TaxID=2003365 RepID=UPI000D7B395D|nr:hypothetical protein [uncultured Marivita sp.]MCR9110562.1 hypothetical protein [Paracoccaceae bacterium]PWL35399.1 MAG: hypothetical protein DCO97_09740 [Marivita sp. XM-24bin2]